MRTIICANCEYDLTGLPNDAPCPECASTLREERRTLDQHRRLVVALVVVLTLAFLASIAWLLLVLTIP